MKNRNWNYGLTLNCAYNKVSIYWGKLTKCENQGFTLHIYFLSVPFQYEIVNNEDIKLTTWYNIFILTTSLFILQCWSNQHHKLSILSTCIIFFCLISLFLLVIMSLCLRFCHFLLKVTKKKTLHLPAQLAVLHICNHWALYIQCSMFVLDENMRRVEIELNYVVWNR